VLATLYCRILLCIKNNKLARHNTQVIATYDLNFNNPFFEQNIILHPFGRLDMKSEAVVIEALPSDAEGNPTVAQR
jgi:hypothetical protein